MEEQQNQQQQQENTVTITKGEYLEKKKQLLESDKDKRREDSKGEDRSSWGKFNKMEEKEMEERNNQQMNRKKKQEFKEEIEIKLKKALEMELKKIKGEDYNEDGNETKKKDGRFEKKQKKQEYLEKIKDAPRVVVDFQFVDQTMERDRASLMKQIEVCYSENRNAEKPLKLTCSQGEHELMQKHIETRSAKNWGIDFEPKDILEAYNKEDIIYMSGDVDVDMDEYEPDKTYIIGGLVEHNRLINLTKNYCAEHGIKARRLPLNRYLDLRACHLLNINHVFSILLKLHNGKSWKEAITTSVPKRKIGDVLFDDSDDNDDEEELEKIEKKQKTEDDNQQQQEKQCEQQDKQQE